MERLRQLDEHYHSMMRRSDRLSTPFKRITRLFHVLVQKKVRTHVRINDKVIDANGMDKSKDGMCFSSQLSIRIRSSLIA